MNMPKRASRHHCMRASRLKLAGEATSAAWAETAERKQQTEISKVVVIRIQSSKSKTWEAQRRADKNVYPTKWCGILPNMANFMVADLNSIEAVRCPCGWAKRAFAT